MVIIPESILRDAFETDTMTIYGGLYYDIITIECNHN